MLSGLVFLNLTSKIEIKSFKVFVFNDTTKGFRQLKARSLISHTFTGPPRLLTNNHWTRPIGQEKRTL